MKLVSIIIPFYSYKSGLLIKSVSSVLNQTYDNLEVIVVDDCSPCDAEAELSSIKDPRLKIVKHLVNKNGAIARNTGVNSSCGDVIAFLDYDDEWYPQKLQLQVDKLEEKGDEYVIYSRCKIIEPSGRTFLRPRREILAEEKVGDYLFNACEIIQTSGILLSRNLADKVKFDDLKRHQDYQYCLALENAGAKFSLVEDCVYDFIQIPKKNDHVFSLSWLDKYKCFLSVQAQLGFKKLVVLRSVVENGSYSEALYFSHKNKILTYFVSTCCIKLVKAFLPNKLLRKFK